MDRGAVLRVTGADLLSQGRRRRRPQSRVLRRPHDGGVHRHEEIAAGAGGGSALVNLMRTGRFFVAMIKVPDNGACLRRRAERPCYPRHSG